MGKIHLVIILLALVAVACSSSTPPSSEGEGQPTAVIEEISFPTEIPQEITAPEPTPTLVEIEPTAPPEAALQGVDACTIFTLEEVSKFVGQEMEPGDAPVQGEGIGIVTSCAYQIVGTSWERASVIVRTLDDVEFSASFFTQTRTNDETYLEVSTEDVSGVGDEAYWIGDIYNQLAVRKGNVHLLFSITGRDSVSEEYLNFVNQVLTHLP